MSQTHKEIVARNVAGDDPDFSPEFAVRKDAKI